METGESAAEALGRIIPVLERGLNDPDAGRSQLLSRQGEPPHPDVFSQCEPAEDTEYPLKMKAGRIGLLGRFLIVDGLRHMGFHIIHGPLYPFDPIHRFAPFRMHP